MIFRTEITLSPSSFRINHQTPMVLMGSCFTDNIGNWLEDMLFPVDINPFGIVYNPVSVRSGLEIILENRPFGEKDLFRFNHRYHSWYHHSSFSGEKQDKVLEGINARIRKSHELLKKSRYLVITFGTARIYRLIESGIPVSNCHKVPQKEFSHELLTVESITNAWNELLGKLRAFNPALSFIFTVSPIRHWKDGPHGNQLSKSVLHLAIHNILAVNTDHSEYFPAYELLLDDLRDYRYYDNDLLHPGEMAVQYIREKFSDRYFSPETAAHIQKINELRNALDHRDLSGGSMEYRSFLEKQLEKISRLKNQLDIDGLDLLAEKFKNKLEAL